MNIVYRCIRSIQSTCCFIYSGQVPSTFIPLFSRFISCAHEFRIRWISNWVKTGGGGRGVWSREDRERRSGERGENKKEKGLRGSRVGRPLSIPLTRLYMPHINTGIFTYIDSLLLHIPSP